MTKLHYGDNGIHEFWESRGILILKNHGEKQWTCMKKENGGQSVIGDDKLNAKAPNGTWYCLCAKSSGELAKKIVIQEDMDIEFDYTKTYTGKKNMKLVYKRPSEQVIKESSKR